MKLSDLKELAELDEIKVSVSYVDINLMLSQIINEDEFNNLADNDLVKLISNKIASLPIEKKITIYVKEGV